MTPTLAESYTYCQQITRREAGNFYPAFRILPKDQRLSMCALYASAASWSVAALKWRKFSLMNADTAPEAFGSLSRAGSALSGSRAPPRPYLLSRGPIDPFF